MPLPMLSRRVVAATAASLFLVALPGCEFFSPVVIASHDVISPMAIPSIYEDGEFQILDGDDVFITSDPNRQWVALAACFDFNGARKVTMAREGWATRQTGPFTTTDTFTFVSLTNSQIGEVGDTVDNGVWVGDVVQPGTLSGYTFGLVEAGYRYTVIAEDFHGHTTVTPGPTFIYRP